VSLAAVVGYALTDEEGLLVFLLPNDRRIIAGHLDHHEPFLVALFDGDLLAQSLVLDLDLQVSAGGARFGRWRWRLGGLGDHREADQHSGGEDRGQTDENSAGATASERGHDSLLCPCREVDRTSDKAPLATIARTRSI